MPRSEQFLLAVRAIKTNHKRWRTRFGEIQSIGAGFRIASALVETGGQICIRFVVPKKLQPDLVADGARIPARIRCTFRRADDHIAVMLPTDVVEFEGGRPHDLRGGVNVPLDAGNSATGCVSCFVSMAGSRYALTCYHVFSPQMNGAQTSPQLRDADSTTQIGTFAEHARVSDGPSPADAALVSLTDQTAAFDAWGVGIAFRAGLADLARLPDAAQLSLLGREQVFDPQGNDIPRNAPVAVSFVAYHPVPFSFDYPEAAASFSFGSYVEYRATGASTPLPGDSGAAVVDSDGTLIAMHFWGSGVTGYGLSADLLFQPNVFSGAITFP